MIFKVLFVLGVVAVAAVQGRYELDQKDKECQEETNVGEDIMEIYRKGAGVVPEDVHETERFVICRYGHNLDDEHKLIINDESIAEISNYVRAVLNSNKKLAVTLTKQIMHDCLEAEGTTKNKAIVQICNCVLRELAEYDAVCDEK